MTLYMIVIYWVFFYTCNQLQSLFLKELVDETNLKKYDAYFH